VLSDVFSTQYETESESGEILTETLERELADSETVQASVQLSEDNAQILACFAGFGPVEAVPSGDRTLLRSRGVVTVLSKNSLGEIESSDQAAELSVPLPAAAKAEDLHAECWISAESISCTDGGGTADVSVGLRLEGFLLCRRRYPCVAAVSVGEALQPQDPEVALRIYYAHAGEQIFDIARRFHVSPADMLRANALTDEVLPAGRRLLVPGVG
jgi:hypothetical protein